MTSSASSGQLATGGLGHRGRLHRGLLVGWGLYRAWRNLLEFGVGRRRRVAFRSAKERPCAERKATISHAALAIGWLLCLAAFFVVAGPAAIAPHFERYGICLIGPGAILAALAVGWWLDRPGRMGVRSAAGMALVAGWLLLAGFHANFFAFLPETGGRSHLTFRTAATEPKQAAWDYIKAIAISARHSDILRLWWNTWPLRYLCREGIRSAGGSLPSESARSRASPPSRIRVARARWRDCANSIPSSGRGGSVDRRVQRKPGLRNGAASQPRASSAARGNDDLRFRRPAATDPVQGRPLNAAALRSSSRRRFRDR